MTPCPLPDDLAALRRASASRAREISRSLDLLSAQVPRVRRRLGARLAWAAVLSLACGISAFGGHAWLSSLSLALLSWILLRASDVVADLRLLSRVRGSSRRPELPVARRAPRIDASWPGPRLRAVSASPREMIESLGEPDPWRPGASPLALGVEVSTGWRLCYLGLCLVVHDWRETSSYRAGLPSVSEFRSSEVPVAWSISACLRSEIAERVLDLAVDSLELSLLELRQRALSRTSSLMASEGRAC